MPTEIMIARADCDSNVPHAQASGLTEIGPSRFKPRHL